MKLRIKSVLLAISFLASVLLVPSCAKDNNTPAAATDAVSTSAPDTTSGVEIYKPDLPEKDYGGADFTILSRDDSMHNYPVHTRDIVSEGENGEIINDVVYRRNSTIEEQYNIKIKMVTFVETAGEDQGNKFVEKAVKAGDDVYDLFYTHMILGGGQAQKGIYYNWKQVPYVDLTKPYWSQGAVEGMTVGDKLFLTLSDMCISGNDNTYLMLFNKKLAQEYAIENPYELVRNNKWTFDKLIELAKNSAKDLDGNQKMDNNDQYGLILGGGQLNFMWAGGASITAKDADNRPYITMMSPRMTEIYAKVYEMAVEGRGIYSFNIDSWIDPSVQNMFSANKALFMTTQIGVIEELRNMETEFGILPYPKFNSEQKEYAHYVDGHAPLMAIPTSVQDVERVGIISEALSYESYKYLRPAYYDILLNTKYTRDEESSEMLDIILASQVYDFGYVYDNWTIAFIFAELVTAKKADFVSTYEKKENAGKKNLEKILKAYDEIE